nr:Lrp/AsnC ligand binding domain-containing protein [Sphingomonas liriopis]
MIGIDADPSRVAALARELSDMAEIGCVIVLLGRYSLMAMALMTSVEGLNDLVTDRIRTLAGVRRVETSISIHNLKYEAGVAKISASA